MNATLDPLTTEQPSVNVGEDRVGLRNDLPLFTAIITVVAGIGFSMNCFVLVVILRTKKLKKKISMTFLIGQCIMDTCSTANVLFFYIVQYLKVTLAGRIGEFYCRAIWSEFVIFTALHAAVCNTVALSGERYVAIAHPMTYKSVATRRKFIPIIVACWVIVVLIVCFYVIMLRKLSARTKLTSKGSCKTSRAIGMIESIQTAQMRLTRTAIALGVAFVITWTPYNFYLVTYSAGAALTFADNAYYFSVTFAVGNTVVNPLIYVFSLQEFRTGVKQLCSRRIHGNKQEHYVVNVLSSTAESAI
ncbi:hypothetical protein CAPTEDRAFT_107583 [Capitella teleta]|uniref:G-protein coupled receptors family 1 profile domain-containing protein n=1 Tax=Capitella teleta TaxID=283909 RepID=X1YTY7_CAPTE|nr:hypothetical protein CAPTEDRAFT_107583 [Capitella teleta]|eukprot:ELT88368.1 hypothetical protein CAPTEDRAFT_107583 [Capitella teleta]